MARWIQYLYGLEVGVPGTLFSGAGHTEVSEIRDLIKSYRISVNMSWIKAHIVYTYNERADALAKEVATCCKVNGKIIFLFHTEWKQDSVGGHLLLGKVGETSSVESVVTCTYIKRDTTQRLEEFSLLTGHGAFWYHQALFF